MVQRVAAKTSAFVITRSSILPVPWISRELTPSGPVRARPFAIRNQVPLVQGGAEVGERRALALGLGDGDGGLQVHLESSFVGHRGSVECL